MNLAIICNLKKNNQPEAVIVHNYITAEIGYSTYNDSLSEILETIINNKIIVENVFDDNIFYAECDKNNPYYLTKLNDKLVSPYKILWIKKVHDKMEDLLEQGFEILDKKVE